MKSKISYKVALGGVISSLCLLSMFFTGIMPLMVYAFPAAAGVMLMILVVEVSTKWAFLSYISVGILSFFITPDKEAAMLFIMFFGYYPILKSVLEKLKSRIIEWILKFLSFNAGIVITYLVTIYLLNLQETLEQFGEYGKYGALIFLAIGNIVFVVYDIALTRIISSYINWFRPTILRKRK